MPAWELLIVPYGIETLFVVLAFLPVHLLIVPYGIETYKSKNMGDCTILLLIVPYGIET